jgi:hypothetical protein
MIQICFSAFEIKISLTISVSILHSDIIPLTTLHSNPQSHLKPCQDCLFASSFGMSRGCDSGCAGHFGVRQRHLSLIIAFRFYWPILFFSYQNERRVADFGGRERAMEKLVRMRNWEAYELPTFQGKSIFDRNTETRNQNRSGRRYKLCIGTGFRRRCPTGPRLHSRPTSRLVTVACARSCIDVVAHNRCQSQQQIHRGD